MDCEGKCEKHFGKVRRVMVIDKNAGYNWGEFWYCKSAVLEDMRRGFDVEQIIDEQSK